MDRFAIPVRPDYRLDLGGLRDVLQKAPYEKIEGLWTKIEDGFGADGIRALGRADRFYLLTQICGRADAMHPWLYARCREVEADPDDHLDLWAREHYKSSIITFAGAIQEIILDPEITIAIFSHTKPVARKFKDQIQFELEYNEYLKGLYPEVFYANPRRESPWWNDEGLVVRRTGNPKEATVEAHGLVDGQPTGGHYRLRIYDDVVTRESVTTPEQVTKTTEAWSLSDNLGAKQEDPETGKISPARKWHIGTRYSFGDSYAHMLKVGALKPRIYPATHDGTVAGIPVFFTPEQWAEKKKTQTASSVACQLLQNPAAGNQAMFEKGWLSFAEIRPKTLNVYIMGDPARSKKKNSDKTAIYVVGMDAAWNKYLLDGYHHKMNLRERWQNLKNLYQRWSVEPGVQVVRVGWEDYGRINDIEYFEERMERDKIAFEIEELAWPNDGPGSKIDRVQRLVPDFQHKRIHLTAVITDNEGKKAESRLQRECRERGEGYRVLTPVTRMDENGQAYSLNKLFLEQFFDFPFVPFDDGIDCLSRIYDMNPRPPQIIEERDLTPEVFADGI
jgi:hypothetical protein